MPLLSRKTLGSLQPDLNHPVSFLTKLSVRRSTSPRNSKPILSSYILNNTALELYAAEKDLGVWISKDLTWYKQVNEQSSRTNKLLGYLRGTRGSYLEPK